MTKTEFTELLHRYTNSTRSEAENVLLLEKQYPYSQLLHSLAARVCKDHRLATQQTALQIAAVYAADRHVLKEIMSKSVNTISSNLANPVSTFHSTIDSVDYADAVMNDLKQLDKSRHKFEMLFVDLPKQQIKKAAPVKKQAISKPAASAKKAVKKTAQASKKKLKPTVKSKKLRVKKAVQVKKIAKAKPKTKERTKKAKKHTKPVKKKTQTGEELIAQLELTKKKLKPESPKHREQLQIINQFIKAQPTISQARGNPTHATHADLVPLKQGEFGEQIVSETLVKILASQGKNEKAIEVLKKLIWKFPQKKAYFAAQIEELKQ
jgi:hypothetical protein